MANTVDKVINIAVAEEGYLEKKSEKDLYDKKANAGSGNYTKYGKEMHELYPSIMDYPAPYCDAFVDWCFQKAYGVSNAKGLLGGDFNDYTPASANLYKKKNAYYSTPEVGDQVFFKNETRICHTGLVKRVDKVARVFWTTEGNTNNMVAERKYSFDDPTIDGFGRPKYDVVATSTETASKGGKTVKIELSVLRNGSEGEQVKTLQTLLMAKGYEIGTWGIDGDFGNDTEEAVRQFQSDEGIEADGVVGFDTWTHLLK